MFTYTHVRSPPHIHNQPTMTQEQQGENAVRLEHDGIDFMHNTVRLEHHGLMKQKFQPFNRQQQNKYLSLYIMNAQESQHNIVVKLHLHHSFCTGSSNKQEQKTRKMRKTQFYVILPEGVILIIDSKICDVANYHIYRISAS